MATQFSQKSEHHKKFAALINGNTTFGMEVKKLSENLSASQDDLEKKIDHISFILNTQKIPECPPSEECIAILSAIFQIALIYTSCLNKTGQVVSKEMKEYMGTVSFSNACEYLRSYHDIENDFKSCCKHQTKKCTPDVVAEKINFLFILMFKVIATCQKEIN